MILQGIKNYFKNLKYFFTPLGTIALGLVFGLSVLIPGILAEISTLTGDIKDIVSQADIDWEVLKDSIVAAVRALDWTNPVEALQTVLSSGWIKHTVTDCLESLVESAEVYTSQINSSFVEFRRAVAGYVSICISFIVLGIMGGYMLTKWLIRRNMAKRTLLKYMLSSLFDCVITAVLIFVCAWLGTLWKPSVALSTAAALLLFGSVSLCKAYFLHGRNKVNPREAVNAVNVFKLFITDILIFLIAGAGVLIVILITNMLVGIFVGVALMEIAFIVTGLNAEAYVIDLADKYQLKA